MVTLVYQRYLYLFVDYLMCLANLNRQTAGGHFQVQLEQQLEKRPRSCLACPYISLLYH